MSPFITMIINSYRSNILERKGFDGPGGDHESRWANQLAGAAKALAPEQVADKIDTGMWLNVGARVRCSGPACPGMVQASGDHDTVAVVFCLDDLPQNTRIHVKYGCLKGGVVTTGEEQVPYKPPLSCQLHNNVRTDRRLPPDSCLLTPAF